MQARTQPEICTLRRYCLHMTKQMMCCAPEADLPPERYICAVLDPTPFPPLPPGVGLTLSFKLSRPPNWQSQMLHVAPTQQQA